MRVKPDIGTAKPCCKCQGYGYLLMHTDSGKIRKPMRKSGLTFWEKLLLMVGKNRPIVCMTCRGTGVKDDS